LLVSNKTINNDQWHNVIFKRQGNYGQLIVDEEKVTGYSLGRTTAININPPFFVGGILPEISNIVNTNIVRGLIFNLMLKIAKDMTIFLFQGLNKTFSGCLGNFMMNGQSVGEPSEKVGVIPCSKRVEPGLFFFPGNGSNLFKAGEEIDTNKRLNRNR